MDVCQFPALIPENYLTTKKKKKNNATQCTIVMKQLENRYFEAVFFLIFIELQICHSCHNKIMMFHTQIKRACIRSTVSFTKIVTDRNQYVSRSCDVVNDRNRYVH